MSLIIAAKDKDRVYVGTDSQITYSGILKVYNKEDADVKMYVREKYGIIIATAGSVMRGEALSYIDGLFEDIPKDGLNMEYIVNKIIPKYKEELKRYNLLEDKNYKASDEIIAYKDKIYVIDDVFSVYKINEYTCSGVGRQAVDYIMKQKDKSVKEKVLESLRYVGNNFKYVSGPYKIVDTKELKVEIEE